MPYLRSQRGPRDRSVAMVRILSATCLIAYPFGALVLALGSNSLATVISGYGLILLALISYAPLISTTLQRIVGENAKLLDEYELRLRGRALSVASNTFSGLTLLLVMYAAIATDKGFWVPTTYEAFNGLFWGVFLYSAVLPIAVLSWMVEPDFGAEQL